MTAEAKKTLAIWGDFEKEITKGSGIDIGCGPWPILPHARPFDVSHGDANNIRKYVDEQFDWVFSSHCLEHMYKPYEAIQGWWELVKVGGHLIVTIPDEDLYEQGVFPSRYNYDHKWTFTVAKLNSWSSHSISIAHLAATLNGGQVRSIELHDQGYDYLLENVDQTLPEDGACSQIQLIVRKVK